MSQFVLVVSGLPAAGKTTLAGRLGIDLGLVLVCRDQLQGLFTEVRSVLAKSDQDRLLGASGDALVNHITTAVLDVGHGAVIDGNFNWHFQRDAVRQLIRERRPPGFEIRLWGDPAVLRGRWADREPELIQIPEMSPILDAAYAREREYVLDVAYPRVEIDTTDLGVLDVAYPELVARLRNELDVAQFVS